MRPVTTGPTERARRDLSRFFGGWLIAANLCWLTTPWLDALAPTWGAAWLWAAVIPGASLAALNPRRCAGLLLVGAALAWRAGVALRRPCGFRLAR